MTKDILKARTKALALRVIQLVEALPKNKTTEVIGRQLIRCGCSVGANYRAACRAKSHADFINKMGIVEEEADEVLYWLELLVDSKHLNVEHSTPLTKEMNEILSMTVASIKTARQHLTPKSEIRNPK